MRDEPEPVGVSVTGYWGWGLCTVIVNTRASLHTVKMSTELQMLAITQPQQEIPIP
jgi:hypothetical protein